MKGEISVVEEKKMLFDAMMKKVTILYGFRPTVLKQQKQARSLQSHVTTNAFFHMVPILLLSNHRQLSTFGSKSR